MAIPKFVEKKQANGWVLLGTLLVLAAMWTAIIWAIVAGWSFLMHT